MSRHLVAAHAVRTQRPTGRTRPGGTHDRDPAPPIGERRPNAGRRPPNHGGIPMNVRIDEVADLIYRFSTFVPNAGPTGFTFNQYVVVDDEPLLFHTGPRALFPHL